MRLALLVIFLALQTNPSVPQTESPRKDHKTTTNNQDTPTKSQKDSANYDDALPATYKVTNCYEQQSDTAKMEERRDRKAQLRIDCVGVWITGIGVAGAWVGLFFIYRQTRLAQKTLVSTFRPKIIIRNVAFSETGKEVRYVVTNCGGPRAKLIVHSEIVQDIEGKSLPLALKYATEIVDSRVVRAGEIAENRVSLDAAATAHIQYDRTAKDGGSLEPGSVHLFGYVRYQDDNGIIRRTAFCRLFNVQTNRFEAVANPDHEYAD